MEPFNPRRLNSLFASFLTKKIAVVGDLMLDRYFWGRVARISPEAPVPVVEVDSEASRLGGAANVAHNIASLGATPLIIGVVGQDEGGEIIRSLAREAGFPDEGILSDVSRPTTCKSRVIAHNQHVVRIDKESKRDIDETTIDRILSILEQNVDSLDAIILEDYNKGVIVRSLIHNIISLAKRHDLIVAVDPKFNNFFEYQGVTVFKPNRKEAEEALGMRLNTSEGINAAGRMLLNRLSAENILLTLGEQGMSLFRQSGEVHSVPTKARKVADVSGAGDTVISTLTTALAGGASMEEAAVLANYAGGIVCGEVGIVPINPDALREAVLEESTSFPPYDDSNSISSNILGQAPGSKDFIHSNWTNKFS
jgi:D-glycero-beta-D-manno-heptose-7-phosphate kinase